jgi:hypothetical protein
VHNYPQAFASFNLADSNLPEYLVSNYIVDEEAKSEKTHSMDSNSENADGNDYGDTPVSSRRHSSDDGDHSSDLDNEDDKTRRLIKMMDKNEASDCDDDDYQYGMKVNRKGKYKHVAYDAWHDRDDEY